MLLLVYGNFKAIYYYFCLLTSLEAFLVDQPVYRIRLKKKNQKKLYQ